jgi:hypothetical protein
LVGVRIERGAKHFVIVDTRTHVRPILTQLCGEQFAYGAGSLSTAMPGDAMPPSVHALFDRGAQKPKNKNAGQFEIQPVICRGIATLGRGTSRSKAKRPCARNVVQSVIRQRFVGVHPCFDRFRRIVRFYIVVHILPDEVKQNCALAKKRVEVTARIQRSTSRASAIAPPAACAHEVLIPRTSRPISP